MTFPRSGTPPRAVRSPVARINQLLYDADLDRSLSKHGFCMALGDTAYGAIAHAEELSRLYGREPSS